MCRSRAGWLCIAVAFALSSEVGICQEPATPPAPDLRIVIDTNTELGELYNFWNVYPVTVQAPFLEEGQFDTLRQTYRYAKYINCVRFLGGIDLEKDDYFRGVDEEGEAICDFTEGIAMLSGASAVAASRLGSCWIMSRLPCATVPRRIATATPSRRPISRSGAAMSANSWKRSSMSLDATRFAAGDSASGLNPT